MNTFLVTFSNGTTAEVRGESYIAGGLARSLVVIDQFGGPIATYAAGTWTGIAVVVVDPALPVQPVITASDPNVPGTYLNGRSIYNGPDGG